MTTETDAEVAVNRLLDTTRDALDDLKALEPVVLDVRALSSVMDWMVVAS